MDVSPGSALVAYERLAPHYDTFTFEHDYEGWTASLERVLLAHGLRGRRLLDVACGTGRSFEPFLRRGYRVTACDLSPRMLDVARGRADAETRLLATDMRALPRLGRFDAVVCLDDAINYLDSPDDLVRAFRSARRQLAPHGVYLFDVNTLATYRDAFARTFAFARDGVSFQWTGHPAPDTGPGDQVTATLTIEAGADREVSVHTQRHHPPARVRAALRRAGLRCLAVYGQLPDGKPRRPLDELHHTKAIYVAARPAHEENRRR